MMDKAELDKLAADLRKKSDAELIVFRVSNAAGSEPAALADSELQRRLHRKTLFSGAFIGIIGAVIGSLLTFFLGSQLESHKFQYFVPHAGTCTGERFDPGTCETYLNELGENGWRLVGLSDRGMYFVKAK